MLGVFCGLAGDLFAVRTQGFGWNCLYLVWKADSHFLKIFVLWISLYLNFVCAWCGVFIFVWFAVFVVVVMVLLVFCWWFGLVVFWILVFVGFFGFFRCFVVVVLIAR